MNLRHFNENIFSWPQTLILTLVLSPALTLTLSSRGYAAPIDELPAPQIEASPQLEPNTQPSSVAQDPVAKDSLVQDSRMETFDSLEIKAPQEGATPTKNYLLKLEGKNRLVYSMGGYYGPYSSTRRGVTLYGFSYQKILDPSQRLEAGFFLGFQGEANPLFYLNQETRIRNSWKQLHSAHWALQMEWDTALFYPTVFKLSQFALGGGLSFLDSEDFNLRLTLFPLATRGQGASLTFRWLFSGF